MSQLLERKKNLDIVKLFCALLVVCVHVPFPGQTGTAVLALARVAVPVFLMITGFFYGTVKENGKEKQQIIKVLKLTTVANVLYFAWGILFSFVTGGPAAYIAQTVNSSTMMDFVLFNESPFGIHLWYLTCLLFVLLIMFFLTKKEELFRSSYWLIPVLLLGNLILGKYAPVLWGREFKLQFVRNFLFVGLPYVLLGAFLSEKYQFLKNAFRDRLWIPALLTVFFAATSLLESWLLNAAEKDSAGDNYISTTFLACAVVILAVVGPEVKENNLLARLGRATSTDVYIFHLIVKDVLAILLTGLFGSSYPWVRPICVFAASIMLALVLKMAVGWVKQKGRGKQSC